MKIRGGREEKFYGSKKDCFEVHIFQRFCKIIFRLSLENMYFNCIRWIQPKNPSLQNIIILAMINISAS